MQNANSLGYNAATVQQQARTQIPTTHNVGTTEPLRSFVQPLIVDETKQYMEGLVHDDDDDDDDKLENSDKKSGKKTKGRVKIKMEFIQNKLRRYTTFSKRKTGIMKKAYELSTLTGTQVMLLVASETGHVYTFATRKLQPMITSESGKALIQTCLNSPDPSPANNQSQQLQSADGNPVSISQETSPPTQVNIPVATVSRVSHNLEESELQYSSQIDEETKAAASQSTSSSIGTINYVNQSGQSFPMTAYIAPAVSQSQTTIFTPGNSTNQNSAVQLQASSTIATQQQPQILSGQLHVHRIHPQNILLTGSSPVLQSNHIILNQQPANGHQPSLVVTDTPHVVATTRHSHGSTQQDVIALVNPELSTSRVQMVYSPGGSAVIYAPHANNLKRSDNSGGNDVMTLQHTPVIQSATISQDGANG